mgnify:FL=1
MSNFKFFSIKKTPEILLLNLFLLPIYPDNFKPACIGIFAFFSLLFHIKVVGFSIKFNNLFFINCSLFLVLLLSLFYTHNLKEGFSNIFRLLPLIIFPISFLSLKSNTTIFSNKTFIKGKLLFYCATLILFVCIFINFFLRGFVTENFFLNYSYRIIFQLGKYSMHPIYASLIASIALIFSINFYKFKKYRLLFLTGNIILVINLILLSRKSVLIFMSVFYILYLFLNTKFSKKLKFFSAVFFIILFITVVKLIPDISNRFNDFSSLSDSSKATSTNLRVRLTQLSLLAIKKEPLLGYGIGDVKDKLITLENQHQFFKNNYYNTHNQFLGITLSCGLLGLFIFLYFLYKNIKINFKDNKDNLIIIFIFVSLMFIENLLDRQNGIIYFSFFINYFSFQKKSIE